MIRVRNDFRQAIVWSTIAVGLVIGTAARADLTSFTPGDIVLMRGGDATLSQQTYAEVPAYLDEYSISISGDVATASLVGSFPVPQETLTLPGFIATATNPGGADFSSHEGRINLSGDGHYLNFAGYRVPPSITDRRVTDGSGGNDYYQIGQVSGNAGFVHSALDTAVAFPQYVRAAYSNDGNEVWVGSKYIPGPGISRVGGGFEYISGFGAAPTTVALQDGTDWRNVQVVGGQLYGGTGSSSVGQHGFYSIGTGAPIVPTASNTLLGPNSNNSASSFSFVTLPGGLPINGVAGTPNVVYTVGDPSSGYIGKLFLPPANSPLAPSSLQFTLGANNTPATLTLPFRPEGVLAKVDPNNSTRIDLFVQSFDGVYFAIDKSGTADGSIAGLNFAKIISNTADTAFYGIAAAPSPPPLKGDINLDNHVNQADLPALLSALADLNYYRTVLHPNLNDNDFLTVFDINSDGAVTNGDIQPLLDELAGGGAGLGSVSAVPEPSTIALMTMALAGTVFIGRRGRRLVCDSLQACDCSQV